MKYKIVRANNPHDFETKVNDSLKLGWQPLGTHLNNDGFYSLSMVLDGDDVLQTDIKTEVIHLLESIKTDAEMALDGRWDCTTMEGKETGFEAQIYLINKLLDKMK
jgi:hypothetical protein